jgi:hypothetical protein
MVVNRGEFVVNCVVNRGALGTLFRRLKFSSFLKYIFGRPWWQDEAGNLQVTMRV